jgi:hypothetical protein
MEDVLHIFLKGSRHLALRTQKAALSRGLSIAKVGTLFQLQSSG